MPTLSLCIPAYNAAEYLPRLLESARQQTIPFDEIWVYNDCSQDQTEAIARSLGAKVITGKTNLGCSHGKNALLEQVKTDWIHFHDADDDLYPHFVETAHRWMNQPDAPDVVLFDYEARDYDTNQKLYIRTFDHAALRQDAIAYNIREQVNPFCGLYRREAIAQSGGYDTTPEVLYNEDVAFHCRLAIAGLSFAADPEVTVINFCRANSMSSGNAVKCLHAQYHVMKTVAAQVSDVYFPAISQRLWDIASVSAAWSDWKNADACLTLARQLTPASLPSNCPRWLTAMIAIAPPQFALRLREHLIRALKPNLRRMQQA